MKIFGFFLFWFYLLLMAPSKCSETFDGALEVEQFYSKHRNSDDFREEQAKKQLKREHPVNYNHSGSDFIDVNNMMKKIDAGDVEEHHKLFCSVLFQKIL